MWLNAGCAGVWRQQRGYGVRGDPRVRQGMPVYARDRHMLGKAHHLDNYKPGPKYARNWFEFRVRALLVGAWDIYGSGSASETHPTPGFFENPIKQCEFARSVFALIARHQLTDISFKLWDATDCTALVVAPVDDGDPVSDAQESEADVVPAHPIPPAALPLFHPAGYDGWQSTFDLVCNLRCYYLICSILADTFYLYCRLCWLTARTECFVIIRPRPKRYVQLFWRLKESMLKYVDVDCPNAAARYSRPGWCVLSFLVVTAFVHMLSSTVLDIDSGQVWFAS